MKTVILVALSIAFLSFDTGWQTNFSKAKDQAKQEHKLLLLSFSGSDWCGPCIKTRKEIFLNKTFTTFADAKLVLVNADFPRLSKNKLSKEQVKANEALAESYDKQGVFPLTILMDGNGKILKTWTGYPGVTPDKFIEQIRSFGNGN